MTPSGFGGMESILRQAQKMQKQMARLQEDLKDRVVEGTAGGGVVKAHVNCAMEVLSVKIDPEVVDPSDVAMLEDLVVAAISQATKEAQKIRDAEMAKVTGGLGLPGMGLGF
ncbi:MAG TPA: YbaB/EbfC family nucleoid-associated protein [Planctomycetes bacterium]|nr:YbaB/EbfC family nucleoid-associated protein [Planctomycetota bacterium]